MADLVRYHVDGGIATITIDSPEDRNALSAQVVTELATSLSTADADRGVRAVVLTGEGTTFCSGAKLGDGAAPVESIAGLLESLWNFPKTTIALVNGHARAGGIGLVATADMAVAPVEATFAFSEVRVGVAPAMIAVFCCLRMQPRPLARSMLTGEVFSAPEAFAAGLLTAAVPREELDRELEQILGGLRLAEPHAAAETKALLRDLPKLAIDDGLRHAIGVSARLFASPEAAEGMRAFREKRPPLWAVTL